MMSAGFRTRWRAGVALAVAAGMMGALGVAAPAPALAQAASARDAGAEAFIDTSARKVLAAINQHRPGADRRAAFHAVISDLVDWPRVSRFVLGKYARTATPDQLARFAAAYRAYDEGVYQRRIEDYHGERAVVTGSTARKPGDVIVITRVYSAGGEAPLDLAWRVLAGPGGWKLVDVQVKGVWLAITQQQDFVSTIDNAGGKVDVLINQLQAEPGRGR